MSASLLGSRPSAAAAEKSPGDVFQPEQPETAVPAKRPEFPKREPFMAVDGAFATAGAVGLLTGLAASGLPWAAPISSYILGAVVGVPIGAEVGSGVSSESLAPHLGGGIVGVAAGATAAVLARTLPGNVGLGLAVAGTTSAVTLGALLLWRYLDLRQIRSEASGQGDSSR